MSNPQIRRGSQRRRRILAAAVELSPPAGFSLSGVPQLAEVVGMTTSALLHYFGCKDRLLREVAEEHNRLRMSQPLATTLAAATAHEEPLE